MPNDAPSVADIFRRAQTILREKPEMPLRDLKAQLVKEYKGGPFPSLHNLAIPEQDARAPEEDWSAGLSLVRRGIQQEDWNDLANGILLSLEQTVKYERERGRSGTADQWHDRSAGIKDAINKGVSKWMPPELMSIAEKAGKK